MSSSNNLGSGSKAIDIANQFVYVSLIAGPKRKLNCREGDCILEMKPSPMTADMYYLMQLLYCNNYTYDTLIEHHTQHTEKVLKKSCNNHG